jgi:hypothetical protein
MSIHWFTSSVNRLLCGMRLLSTSLRLSLGRYQVLTLGDAIAQLGKTS